MPDLERPALTVRSVVSNMEFVSIFSYQQNSSVCTQLIIKSTTTLKVIKVGERELDGNFLAQL